MASGNWTSSFRGPMLRGCGWSPAPLRKDIPHTCIFAIDNRLITVRNSIVRPVWDAAWHEPHHEGQTESLEAASCMPARYHGLGGAFVLDVQNGNAPSPSSLLYNHHHPSPPPFSPLFSFNERIDHNSDRDTYRATHSLNDLERRKTCGERVVARSTARYPAYGTLGATIYDDNEHPKVSRMIRLPPSRASHGRHEASPCPPITPTSGPRTTATTGGSANYAGTDWGKSYDSGVRRHPIAMSPPGVLSNDARVSPPQFVACCSAAAISMNAVALEPARVYTTHSPSLKFTSTFGTRDVPYYYHEWLVLREYAQRKSGYSIANPQSIASILRALSAASVPAAIECHPESSCSSAPAISHPPLTLSLGDIVETAHIPSPSPNSSSGPPPPYHAYSQEGYVRYDSTSLRASSGILLRCEVLQH
ncbi:hypothetical protein BDZ89DRAFT_1048820 [Hymenopellis radicata]|nr:hypothetical protein BDZ89DRAFT_1048820 [Hymenopellis radicata]